MNEDRKKRGLANGKFLTAVAISTLLLGNGNLFATPITASNSSYEITEQLQAVTISGVIVDATGEPIIGASVVEKGTTNGGITDIDGKFTLNVKPGAILKISYVGYKTQEIKATKTMRIVLKEDSEILNEVVVVGYGTQKKENLTGAVSSVDVNKTLEGRPIADVGRGLQGTTPGMSITLPDSEVGSDPTIKIRGAFASINGKTSPLILLDNVEIPSITLVNPDDIESISVLKDAASSSIYGAKAAFGVVLITTKKGAKTDKVNVTYSGNLSWQSTAKDYNMGGIESLEYIWDATKNANGVKAGAFYFVTEEGLKRAQEWDKKYGGKLGPNDPTVYGRDWYWDAANNAKIGLRTYDAYDYMVKQNAPTQQHNLSVNGKSGNTTFNIGLGYLDQSGMMKSAKKDGFERYNASIRLSTQFNKYVTFNAGAIYSKREKSYPYVTSSYLDQWYYLYRWTATYPMGVDENGKDMRSPWSEYKQANTAKYTQNYTNINLGMHLDLTKGWTADFDYTHANEEIIWFRPGMRFAAAQTWTTPVARVDGNGNTIYVNSDGQVVSSTAEGAMPAYDLPYQTYTAAGGNPDHIFRRATNTMRNTINAYTTYNLDLDKDNHLKFMLGMNRVDYVKEYQESQRLQNLDFSNVQFTGAVGTQTVAGSKEWESQIGFFGRINYNFMDKYLVEGNLRYDGTSKFPTSMQYRWFPSFSVGWRLGEEAFMEWAKPHLSSLKLRGSYGIIGDQTVPNGMYVSNMGAIQQSSWLDESGNRVNYVYAPSAVATDVTWQDIATLDFGVDARFLDNELGVTFDWYKRDTKNMIVPAEGVAGVYGVTAPSGNYGNLQTKGWELSIDYNHRFKNGLGINAMFTLSDAITKVTEYGSTTDISSSKWYNGKTYGEIWGFRADRLYQANDFEHDGAGNLVSWVIPDDSYGAKNKGKTVYKLKEGHDHYQGSIQSGSFYFQPGDVMYKDLNGDGQIDRGANSLNDHGDLEVIGNTTPRYEYGLRLGADYKSFDVSIFFQGVGKRDMWGSSSTTLSGFNTGDGAIAKRFSTNYWTPERTDAFYPRAWNMANSTDALNMCISDRYLLDMSYLRIKNITVGYTLPVNITKKAWIQKARIYGALENFFTFDHLDGTPVDPEIVKGVGSAGLASSDNYQAGRAGISTPAFKSFSVGIQLNF